MLSVIYLMHFHVHCNLIVCHSCTVWLALSLLYLSLMLVIIYAFIANVHIAHVPCVL